MLKQVDPSLECGKVGFGRQLPTGLYDGHYRGRSRSSSRVLIRVRRSFPASIRSRLASIATRRLLRCWLASDISLPNTTVMSMKPRAVTVARMPIEEGGRFGAARPAQRPLRSRRRVSARRQRLCSPLDLSLPDAHLTAVPSPPGQTPLWSASRIRDRPRSQGGLPTASPWCPNQPDRLSAHPQSGGYGSA